MQKQLMIEPTPMQIDASYLLQWIMSRGVHEYLDVAGRPIGEGRSSAFQHVKTELRSCPYAGSRYRHDKPMNITALQQMPEWNQILTLLSWLSQCFIKGQSRNLESYDDLASVTSAGIFLADYLTLRKYKPLQSGEVPILISGLYKVCLGLQLAHVTDRFSEKPVAVQLPDAAGFYSYLEESELLIGESEVCAGPPAMILQAYDALVTPRNVSESDIRLLCGELDIDWNRFGVFADHAGLIWRDLVMFALKMPAFCPQIEDPGIPSEEQDRLNALLANRAEELLTKQSGLAVELAGLVREFSDNVSEADPQNSPLSVARDPNPDSLAGIVIKWLQSVDGPTMAMYGGLIQEYLDRKLGIYDEYEAGVVDKVNSNLTTILGALDFQSSASLTALDLSEVFGRTLRNWQEP